MIGTYDFCAHYEWTFAWLEKQFGKEFLLSFFDEAIHRDSQLKAKNLITELGFEGMKEYWGHTLDKEGAEYTWRMGPDYFRMDMHDCPSKGFLMRNELEQHADYCDHCMGWIGPLMKEAGFSIDHQHNHRGQCWWVFSADGEDPPSVALESDENDVRRRKDWDDDNTPVDTFFRANGIPDKKNQTE